MPRAVSIDTIVAPAPRARRRARGAAPIPAPVPTFIDPADLPDQYVMRVSGDCMSPEFKHGDALWFDKNAVPAVGDAVIFYLRPELVKQGGFQAQIKRLTMAIPPWVKFPYREHLDSSVAALLVVESLNPRRMIAIRCEDVLAVHKCMGHMPEQAA